MATSRKTQTQRTAFAFCSLLNILVAGQSANCSGCQTDTTFAVNADGIVRKRRAAKLAELERSIQSRDIAFQLHGFNNSFSRSRKHHTSHRNGKSFIVDSGASVTVSNRIDIFESIEDYHPDKKVQVANKQYVHVQLVGTVRLTLTDKDGKPYTILLRNVYYSPHFSCNLLSVEELYKQHGITTKFGAECELSTRDGASIPLPRSGQRQYWLHAYAAAAVDPELWHRRLMHIGAKAMQRMQKCVPGIVAPDGNLKCDACLQGGSTKLPFGTPDRRIKVAESFIKRKKFTAFGQRIASDLCGPFPDGIDGEKYAIVFHDSYSKYIAVYTLRDKTKETVLGAFQRFLSEHSDYLPNGVREFWTDNGGEYINADMDQFCEEICVTRSKTVPYAPPQNPYAERAWGTVLRKVRTALVDSGAQDKFWPQAIVQAALVHNIVCDENCKTPYECVHGEKFDYSRLHVFGCLCYYFVPERDRTSKLSPRSLPAIYLGCDPARNGHVVYVPGLQRLTSGYHVVFNEYKRFADNTFRSKVSFDESEPIVQQPIGQSNRHYLEDRDYDANVENGRQHDDHAMDPLDPNYSPANDMRHGDSTSWNEGHCENSRCLYPKGHSGPCSHMEVRDNRFRPRVRKNYAEALTENHVFYRQNYAQCATDDCVFFGQHSGPCEDRYGFEVCSPCDSDDSDESESYADAYVVTDFSGHILRVDINGELRDPESYNDAISGVLGPRWRESMQAEITALMENGTWVSISRSDKRLRNRRPTKSRWVYKIKYKRDGTIDKFKSRFVVCGYSQRQGIDYDRAFSATMRAASFRTMLSIAAGRKLRLVHFDVSNAFTQAKLDDVDLFVEPAPGFEEWETINGKRVSKVLHLQQALYGTKQASRLWQETLRAFLVGFGFVPSKADPCVYRYHRGCEEILIGVYVDDIVVAYRGDKAFASFQKAFQSRFKSTFEGKLQWFLGMSIDQHDDFTIHLSHERNIQGMVDRYIPHNTVAREYPPNELFNKLGRATSDVERTKVKPYNYASIVGALLYVAVMSRPDISFHASVLAKYMSDPSEDCCKAATQLLQYLASTKSKKMFFSGQVSVPTGMEKHAADILNNYGFVAYSDSSWGNKYPYPMFGYGIYLYGSLISFGSKQLKTVAFSSCEAEYAAASYCCKEIEFIRNLCLDLGVILEGRLVLGVDNTAVIDIAHDVGVSSRTKHFDRAIHYLRDMTQLRRIVPTFVSTTQQKADGYTKALDKSSYFKWLSLTFH